MDRNRNRRKGLPSDENIVISLEANQKRKVNINDENYESDNVSGKRMRNSDSTRIVGTDTRMSNLDTRMSSLDICMSRLDIRVSKVILESGKTKTAKNSRLRVAFRMFFQNFCRPIG